MKFNKTPIASAVALAFISATCPAQAQESDAKPVAKSEAQKPNGQPDKSATKVAQAPSQQGDIKVAQATPTPAPNQPPPSDITMTVTGIRYSVEKSLEAKRNSDSLVEVITAEDIGKLPDKNVADAVQRVPGVTISSAAGGEGGFDENDRVSLRGTNPSLTQTLVNGHAIATGDWFVLDQVGTVGRSVSFSLLPSELVSQVIVRKSATADLTEGGIAGAVDIITRKPLDFLKRLTIEAQAQAVYADLPGKWDPQVSALLKERGEHGGRDDPGVLREPAPSPRRAGNPRLRKDLADEPDGDGASGARERRVSDADRLGAVRAEARAARWAARHPDQADERSDVRLQYVLFAHEGDQLQPELDVLGSPRHRQRQRTDTELVHRQQRYAHVGGVPESGHRDRQASVRDRRRDLPSGCLLRNRVLQPRCELPGDRSAVVHRSGRLYARHRQDAQAGRVRGRRVQHRRDIQDARHILAGGRRIPERRSIQLRRHVARLDLRRQPREIGGQGKLRADRRYIRTGDGTGVQHQRRRALRRAQARVDVDRARSELRARPVQPSQPTALERRNV